MNKVEKYVFVKEKFETKRIDKVKLSDAKAWLIKLQKDGREKRYQDWETGVCRM